MGAPSGDEAFFTDSAAAKFSNNPLRHWPGAALIRPQLSHLWEYML